MHRLILGMPTLIETSTLEESVEICSELGLDFVEINMNLPQYQINTLNVDKAKRLMEEKNIFFTIHLDENINVSDFNLDVAKAYVDTVLWTIELAKELKIPILNMHMNSGVHFTLPEEKVYLFDKYKDVYLDCLKSFRDICTETIGNSEIKICIENCSGYKNFMREGIDLLLESEVFGLTLDIGHNYIANEVDSQFILGRANRLTHMHIHDAKKNKDHLALGTGEIDLEEKIRIAKENKCRCVLETKTIAGLKESVKYIRHLEST
ncbi:sugar phosphate isomerase/epimerase family protein [Inconstantimicrobium mannanitabidum]|uniref:Uncharacterized protein n=1 Tax=Inconstantimicrobium mannanitabidum TaxID=1604901 RepID=A0ACB5R6J9_9CLOT|nr:sugar phosphate isomerase/epimerase family protein [Clostridium sp. TW13]GKX64750.1 hypothetical protein rsdtw13_00080 [Clostridium sp. TW13]